MIPTVAKVMGDFDKKIGQLEDIREAHLGAIKTSQDKSLRLGKKFGEVEDKLHELLDTVMNYLSAKVKKKQSKLEYDRAVSTNESIKAENSIRVLKKINDDINGGN